MRPPKYELSYGEPEVMNQRITKAIHLISSGNKKLSKEEIEAIEILLNVCEHLSSLKPVYHPKTE